MRSVSRKVLAVAISSVMASNSYSSGFSLYNEVSGANVGDFAARGSSGNDDPTDVFYNPAALSLSRGKKVSISGDGVFPSAKFTGRETTPNTPQVYNLQGANEAFVPSVFYSQTMGERWSFGLGVYVPFGLSTDWPIWGASDSTQSQIQATTFSSAISYKINDQLSIGGAVDIQRVDATFDSAVQLTPGTVLISENQGDSVGYGGHVGLLYQPDSTTRVGLTFQSSIKQSISGQSTMFVQSTGQVLGSNSNLTADPVDLPSQVTLSGHKKWSNRLSFNGTVAYTHWSLIQMISLNGVAGPTTNVEVNTPEHFRDTWRATLGGEYQYSDKISLRGGVGYDQTPTNDVDRNMRMPDSDRLGVAIGARYKYSHALSFDLGYTHLFMENASINDSHEVATTNATTVGNVSSFVNLVAIQANYKMA